MAGKLDAPPPQIFPYARVIVPAEGMREMDRMDSDHFCDE
jgi:hypothetical protein